MTTEGRRLPDLIAVIEAAYRLDVDESTWIAGITESAAPLLDDGHGLAGYLLDTSGARAPAHSPSFTGNDPWNGAWRERWWDARVARMPVKLLADLAGFGTPTYASESCGAVMRGAVVERLARNVPPMPLPPGVHEALVVSGFDASGAGVVLFAFRERASVKNAVDVARWSRVSGHLAAAARLRHRHAMHAEAPGHVVRAPDIDRARLRRNRTSDDALDLWPAMRDGTAIVPSRNGYVAIDNAPAGAPLDSLTARERTVVSLVSLGRSNKAIAYELGIRASTVSTLLSSASRKLDVKGVAGLVGRARGAVQTHPHASRVARERGLTEAEATVLCLLLAGLADREIAAVRGSSRGTVTKQIDAVFRKLGVGSRRELASSFAPWPVADREAKIRA